MGCLFCPVDYDRSEFYHKGDLIDTGYFGEVYRAHDLRSNELVAIKYIPRNKVNWHVARELLNFSRCRHSRIISYKEVFLTPTHLAISMEFAEAGNLLDYINETGPLPENNARWLFQQLIAAADHCHDLDITIKNIKPEKILLIPGTKRQLLKICDFEPLRTDTKPLIDTEIYSAPEVLLNCCKDGKRADVWSAGVVLYCMIFNRHPFVSSAEAAGTDLSSACRSILNCIYDFPVQPQISSELKDLLQNLLVRKPVDRFGTSEIYKHEWFRTGLPSNFFDSIGQPAVPQTQRELKRWKDVVAAAQMRRGFPPLSL